MVILGAPACGKTTLLQKMRYWAALTAYEDVKEQLPVFVALASYAAFVDERLKAGAVYDLLSYLKKTCDEEQFNMLQHYHKKGQLMMLLDGLDECSRVKEPIQRYIATELSKTVGRTVVSSRLAGFNDDFFADNDFEFVQLELCSEETQKLTAKRRMNDADHTEFCQLLTDQPMLSAYATTPLTLSLLIQLFKSKQLESGATSMVMNRGTLYASGVSHMLTFKKQQTEIEKPEIYKPVGRDVKGEVWNFLEILALECHQKGTRDFVPSDVAALGYGELWERLEPYVITYSIPVLMRLEVDLTTAAITRSSSVAETEVAETSGEQPKFMFRFIHLTFQEFFAARRLLTLIEQPAANEPAAAPVKKSRFGFKKSAAAAAPVAVVHPFKDHIQDKLYDAWYREVLLLMASSASDAQFTSLIDFLLTDDAQGVNDHIATIMLEERREHPLYVEKKSAIKALQEKRLLGSVMKALSHPFPELRQQAIVQMQRLDLNLSSIVEQIVAQLTAMKDINRLWFSCASLLESMIALREEGGTDVASDDTLAQTVVDTLLDTTDADVLTKAVQLIGGLNTSSNKVVFSLLGKLETGHRAVLPGAPGLAHFAFQNVTARACFPKSGCTLPQTS